MRNRKDKAEMKNARDVVLSISLIDAPRLKMRNWIDEDALEELCESISKVGLINPIVVVKVGSRFEVVAGHRRLLAMKKLGYGNARCVVVGGGAAVVEAIKYGENFAREDVSEYDEAVYLVSFMSREKLKQSQVARLFGVSEAYVCERVKIATWPNELQVALKDRVLAYSSLRELVRIKDADVRLDYLRHAVRNGCPPSLAKQWADDANAAQRVVSEMRAEREKSGQPTPAEYPRYDCYACETATDVRDLVTVRVCRTCKAAMDSSHVSPEDVAGPPTSS